MIIVLMGVSGSGKTTVGRVLARDLGWRFFDADDFHPPANVAKMHEGHPLDDADRHPWLQALAQLVDELYQARESAVLACSALKHSYQDYLRHGLADVQYVWLTGPESLIRERLAARRGHFMPPALLHSQIETLEPPEGALTIDITPTPEAIASEIRQRLEI